MRLWKKIALGIAAALVALFAVLAAFVVWIGTPTGGSRIGSYPSPRSAVLVIDIQEDYTGPQAKKRFRDGDRIVAATNALLEKAQTKGAAIAYIANVVDNSVARALMGGVNAPGAPGTDIDRRIARVPGGKSFTKGRGDAFSNPALDLFLRENQVDQLFLVGLDAAHCVNATARGALNRGYKVTLLTEGLATESGTSLEELAEGWRKAGAVVRASAEW